MNKPLPPPPPPGPGPRLVKHVPTPFATVGTCWIIAAVIVALLLGGCERVREYRCSPEQVEVVKVQLDLCDRIADGNMYRRRSCYEAAQAAHCEVIADFHRTEIVDMRPETVP